jgi:chemotaxis protein methyltransferase CheR
MPHSPEPWSPEDFRAVAAVLHARHGEALPTQRVTLVRARLQAKLEARGVPSFSWFHEHILKPRPQGSGMQMLIDVSTINHSAFLREPETLGLIVSRLVEQLARGPARAWCAGCAAGQEPYSLAMLLAERTPAALVPGQLEIRATDLSLEMVRAGASAVYEAKDIAGLAPERLRRFFLRGRGPRRGTYRVVPEIRRLIVWQQLDLRAPEWPVPGDCDAVLCRNVVLYVPEPERLPLLDRLAGFLRPGGWLAIGSGELLPGAPRRLERVAPALYRRRAEAS